MIEAYFRFELLRARLKAQHSIKSKARLDCVAYSNPSGYTGLTDFVNGKGQMFIYKIPAREVIKSNRKRLAEWSLTNGKINLSSLYIEDVDFPEYGYGYPNANRLLSNGNSNPLFFFRNDCYLFITNKEISSIEVLVIPEGRNLVNAYYQRLIDGDLDKELHSHRERAKPFFDYESAT
ncbi:hypothetical protein [Pontibacter pamirensis]|uniref:hypothetical protein n=1 Tax=Pontibacter pamirensis TaxID=2562824 RepID=UPI001389FC70|nr:hypothetical protein [Pontibacter pamirensis]